MPFASIMVAADRSEKAINRYRLARDLAETFEARLIGVGARMIDMPNTMYGDSYPLVLPDFEREARQELSGVHETFQKALQGFNRAEWRGELDEPLRFLMEQSRAADLIVVGRRGDDDIVDRNFGVDPGDAVMEGGRPILMAPPWVTSLRGKRIVVAWSDTREARRAVYDALPFLQRAEEVSVVEVTPTVKSNLSIKDVVTFLTGHAVTAEAHMIEAVDSPPEAAVLEHAVNMNADLVVSGAYGHSRLRETIFGGVTRGLLKHSDICCLMSH